MTRIQQQLHNEYHEQLKLVWNSPKMVDYCTKHADMVVKTSDGYYLEIDRQSIKKHFCFGYGYCGVSTEKDRDLANESAKYARTSVKNFIEENLKWHDSWIKSIEEHGAYITKNGKYCSQKENCLIRGFTSGESTWYHRIENDENYRKLSDEDTAQLLQAFKDSRENMIKRLNTYLKKYGLSKLRVWTYLSD